MKRAISVTLDPDNLLWLKTHARATRRRSVSDALDDLIRKARAAAGQPARSVIGTVHIDPSDPDLRGADEVVRALFARSLSRQTRRGARRGTSPRRRAHG